MKLQPLTHRCTPWIFACLCGLLAGGCQLPAGMPFGGAPSPRPTPPAPLSQTTAPPAARPAASQPATASQPAAASRPAEAAAPVVAQVGYQRPNATPPAPAGPGQSAAYQTSAHYAGRPAASQTRAARRPAPLGGHVGHSGNACTADCCGGSAPVYPCVPPPSAFGLDPQEFLCDGGDDSPRAMYTRNDRIVGVNLEDTVVKYETARGDIEVTPSNRVCVYAPRFAAVRRINGAITGELATGPVAAERMAGPLGVGAPQPSSAVMSPLGPERQALARGPDGVRGRDLGVHVDALQSPIIVEDYLAVLMNLRVMQTGQLQDEDKPWLAKGAQAALVWSEGLAPEIAVEQVRAEVATVDQAARGLTTYDLPGGRLRVIKMADRKAAQVGDIVTFVLRVDNIGEGPIDGVELTDNLTTRLEYVEESQSSTKGAVFSTEPNDGGSLRLTWKFTDDFEVGEGAIVRFQARVR